jgi:general secretion pathway protein K
MMNADLWGHHKKSSVPGASTGPQAGIALIMVLWVLAILMVIALSFSVMTRTETHSTLSFKEGMEKRFLAEAGIQRAITEIYYRIRNRNVEGNDAWVTDGTSHSDNLGDGEYTVSITDESGKININALTDTSGIILKNLLMNSGVEEETANTIVDSVLDWKESSSTGAHRLSGAGDDYYMSLPVPYKAKHANFDTLEELLLVKGVTSEILYGDDEKKGIIDFLTIYSTTPTISVNAAPKEVLTAVPGITPEIADAIISYRENQKINNIQEVGIPQESVHFINFADSSVFSIDSTGKKNDGKAGFPIRATVKLEGNNKYKFLYYKSPVTFKK